MTVKRKILTIILVSFLPFILIINSVFFISYFGYVKGDEQKDTRESYKTVEYLIKNEESDMEKTVKDWSLWDDTYNFINNKNELYIKSDLPSSTLTNLNLDLMLFLDKKDNIVYSLNNGLNKDIVDGIYTKIISKKDNNEVKSGLLYISGKAYIVAKGAVKKSNGSVESNGNVIIVRQFDNKLINYFNNVSRGRVLISDANKGFQNKTKVNKNISTYSMVINDFNNEKTLRISVTYINNNYNYALFNSIIFSILFVVAIALIFIIDTLEFDKYIFNRLNKVTNFVEKVATTKNPKIRLQMSGNDEIYILASAINKMIDSLSSLNKDIEKIDEKYKIIIDATNDGYLDFYIKTKELYGSPEWNSIIGYRGEEGVSLYKYYLSIIHPECQKQMRSKYYDLINNKIDYFCEEYKLITKNNGIIWILHRGKVAERDENGHSHRIISTITNITERKKNEEKILFLSYKDRLTGLWNRTYMEIELEKLNKDRKAKYFIIEGDINGLKLVNDAFGHKKGDQLIAISANVLTKVCKSDDIISRWGGNEFVILIKGKDDEYVSRLITKINEKCEEESKKFGFSISIALGFSKKSDEAINAEVVMNLAEKRMFRNKLLENSSTRSTTISSILSMLHEKSSETEEHTMRIKKLSMELGRRMGLSKDKLDELELLSLMHDIGKIGIPEQILNKPSKLSEEEWEIMKLHTIKGYKIAESVKELSHISDSILTHHERYDGKGYPKGIKGEEIPLLSRIINIVDSYDVMTHKRVYKEAFNKEYAIEEIKKCSGGQFDPELAEIFLKMLEENDKL